MKRVLIDELRKMEIKYQNLVWYARRYPQCNSRYWNNFDDISRESIFKEMDKIERQYPYEIDQINSKNGDWQHGYHSGCLAAFRFILTASDDSIDPSESTSSRNKLNGSIKSIA